MTREALFEGVNPPDPVGSEEALAYIAKLRGTVGATETVQPRNQDGIMCEKLATERFAVVRAMLPADIAQSFEEGIVFKSDYAGARYGYANGDTLHRKHPYRTYAYAARVLGVASLRGSATLRPFVGMRPELQDSVLAQLLVDAYAYQAIAHASGRSFFTPIRNIGFASPERILDDIRHHPRHDVYYDGTKDHPGYLGLRYRLGS